MIRGKATVDQGRKTVTVTVGDEWHGTWSGVTRDTAFKVIASDGWRRACGVSWVISPADNGHVIDVVKD